MWLTLFTTLLVAGYTPLVHVRAESPVWARKQVVRVLTTVVGQGVRATRHQVTAKNHGSDTKAAYIAAFRSALRERGRPDEFGFLNGMVRGESNGNNRAVNFHPGRWVSRVDKKTGIWRKVWQPPLWYCGLVQTMCRSDAACKRVQRDPRYAADEALRILRLHDNVGGDRTCNWKHGPFHPKCEKLRRSSVPTS